MIKTLWLFLCFITIYLPRKKEPATVAGVRFSILHLFSKMLLMNNLLNASDVQSILKRLDHLTPESQRLWGKMTVDQMLAHCTAALQVANGEARPPRMFIGRILGAAFKKNFFNEKPFPKSSPTDKTFIISDRREFVKEKQLLAGQIQKFFDGGEAGVTQYPHSFFGRLTPTQWSIGMWKHLDHHLRQFGV